MRDVDSLHFVIDLSGALTYLDTPPTLALKHVEGDVARPDRVRAMVRISSLGILSEVGIIGLGSEQYITNPLNQRWENVSSDQRWYFNPVLLFDPDHGIEAVLRETDWTFGVSDGEEDGYVLRGRVPGERLVYLTSGMITSGDVAVEILVGQDDLYVHRIEMVELESEPDDPTRWLIELSDFGKPVDITAPPIEHEE
jgi:hypothetical protein